MNGLWPLRRAAALWHIAAPVAGAVHSINTGSCRYQKPYCPTLLFQPTLNIGFGWNNNLIRASV